MANFFRIQVVFLFLLVISMSTIQFSSAGGPGSLTPQQCAGACDYRCSEAGVKDRCLFYCNLCCKKCLCVPSGTFGHKDECPCYRDWKSKQGKPKCP